MFCCYLESNCCVASFLRAVPSALAWTAGNRHGPSAAVLSWDLGSFSGQFCPVVGIRIPAAPQIRAESREGEEARWLAGSSGTRPGPLAPRSLPALCCLVFRSSFSPVLAQNLLPSLCSQSRHPARGRTSRRRYCSGF